MASSFFPSLLLLFSSNAPAPSDDDAARDPRERSPLRRLSCSEEGSAELALETARRRILTCCLALPNFDSGKRKKIGGKLAHPRPAFFFFSFLPRFAALALFPSLLSFPPIKKSDLSLSLALSLSLSECSNVTSAKRAVGVALFFDTKRRERPSVLPVFCPNWEAAIAR